MVPQDPSPQAPQPARHPSRQTRDKRHPYLSRRGASPDEITLLTALPGTSDHPVTQATRERVKRDATGFRAALQAMSETLPGPALERLRALLPDQ